MSYCTVQDVINLSSVKPEQLRLAKDDTTSMNTILTDWISQAESLINTHCHRTFTDADTTDTLNVVKNVTIRLVSNIISQARARQDTAIIKVSDWKVEYVKDEIFTESLKSDLAPFVVEKRDPRNSIEFEAITGDW